jgi:hypothetical protein
MKNCQGVDQAGNDYAREAETHGRLNFHILQEIRPDAIGCQSAP